VGEMRLFDLDTDTLAVNAGKHGASVDGEPKLTRDDCGWRSDLGPLEYATCRERLDWVTKCARMTHTSGNLRRMRDDK
jgi:hypothetical protein